MLLGGVWIQQDRGWDFVNEFEEFCSHELELKNPLGHMKWTKVPPKPSGKYYEAYKKLVDLYFEYNVRGLMKFRTIVIDTQAFDFKHEIFYGGDYEAGFYNAYCQLLLNWIDKDSKYHIRIASRNIKSASDGDCESIRLLQLKDKINNKLRYRLSYYCRKRGISFTEPVISIESRPAKSRRLIQIADIITGAVGFYWNGEHLKPEVKQGKLSLAQHIANKIGENDLNFQTEDWNDDTLNIFFFDTTKSKYAQN